MPDEGLDGVQAGQEEGGEVAVAAVLAQQGGGMPQPQVRLLGDGEVGVGRVEGAAPGVDGGGAGSGHPGRGDGPTGGAGGSPARAGARGAGAQAGAGATACAGASARGWERRTRDGRMAIV